MTGECIVVIIIQTFSTDTAQICDLHQSFGEHVGFTGSAFPHVDLQRLQ